MISKSSIRKDMLAKRQALGAEEHARLSLRVAERLKEKLQGAAAPVADYFPTKNEPGIEHYDAAPVLGADKILRFRRLTAGQRWVANRYGILEPADGEWVTPRTLLIPCLAFDSRGYRIGYGGGYYDATLRHLRGQGPILAIGVAFDFQKIPAVPDESCDERLDAVVTESGYITIT